MTEKTMRQRIAAVYPSSDSTLLILCVWVVLASGCASPASHQMMIPTDFAPAKKHPETVSVEVKGGTSTDTMGKSQISNEEFAQALVESINNSQTFSKVIPGSGANYLLTAQIVSLEQPTFGLSFLVKMEVGWTLKRIDTGKTVWQESIQSEFTATTGDAFIGAKRLRLATEGAARNNISAGLAKISRLDL
jgi:hypothetical protein